VSPVAWHLHHVGIMFCTCFLAMSGVEQHEGRERRVLEGTEICALLFGSESAEWRFLTETSKQTLKAEFKNIKNAIIPVVPHKAVAEVSE